MSAADEQSVSTAWRTTAFVLLAGVFAYRWLWLNASDLPLFYDEAYYLGWSRELAWGYYSKPPLVGWLIRLMTELFGDSEVTIKSTGMLLYSAGTVFIYLTGRDLYGQRVGLWSAFAYASMPFIAIQSLFVAPDAPLVFFWTLTLWAVVRAERSTAPGWWFLAGVAMALGFMAKYAMAFMAVGLLWYLLAERGRWRHFRNPGLWAGVAAVLAMAFFNLRWNMQHDFITVQHHVEIAHWDRASEFFNLPGLLAFWGWQFGVMGPVLLFALLRVFWHRQAFVDARAALLTMTSLPAFVVVSGQAFLARAYQNWAITTYIGAVILVTAWLLHSGRRWALILALAVNFGFMFGFYHLHALADLAGIEMQARIDPYKRVAGWREMGTEIADWRAAYPQARLLSPSRRITALMSYYSAPRYPDVAGMVEANGWIDDQYQLEYDVARFPDAEFLFLSPQPIGERVRASFDQVVPLGRREVVVYPDYTRVLYGYWLQGFRGY